VAVNTWVIHGLRCPGAKPLIDWRWLRGAVSQELATLPKADAEVPRSLSEGSEAAFVWDFCPAAGAGAEG
jgi:hypothetical protein